MGNNGGEQMSENLFSIQSYGVLGYSLAMALALACVSVGVAYWRAGRDRLKAATFSASAFLFAVLFFYLVLVSVDPPWLDRTIMQPLMRTVTLVAAACGWAHLFLLLRKEAHHNGTNKHAGLQNGEEG